ncbi:uncharacterized protein BDW47DRAFT_98165 [Aspergillus candidus]|uniref:Uncharacterized protein n=1 Tax=Aspergillus candidus TaxID=41067 RepID=A0A2I2FNR8_ASPCN|nr:hypothetical protein BDW47DRAFT_98165 [Aspergillus candidus]PLB42260.1 hypothetical protein BDW47DRAFT_98165 [Aspergillus candidus]
MPCDARPCHDVTPNRREIEREHKPEIEPNQAYPTPAITQPVTRGNKTKQKQKQKE